MIEVQRTIPFEYYTYNFTDYSDKNLVYKLVLLSKDIFKNLFYAIANIGIKIANVLHLYTFTKIEVESEKRPNFYKPLQSLTATSFIIDRTFNKLFGPNFISSSAKFVGNFIQNGEGAPSFENGTLTLVYIVACFALSKNSYFNLAISTWKTYSITRNAYNGLKVCHEYAYRDPLGAIKGAFFHLVNIATVLNDLGQNSYFNIPKQQTAS